MSEDHKELLKDNHIFLLENLELEGILDHLYEDKIITQNHTEAIQVSVIVYKEYFFRSKRFGCLNFLLCALCCLN